MREAHFWRHEDRIVREADHRVRQASEVASLHGQLSAAGPAQSEHDGLKHERWADQGPVSERREVAEDLALLFGGV